MGKKYFIFALMVSIAFACSKDKDKQDPIPTNTVEITGVKTYTLKGGFSLYYLPADSEHNFYKVYLYSTERTDSSGIVTGTDGIKISFEVNSPLSHNLYPLGTFKEGIFSTLNNPYTYNYIDADGKETQDFLVSGDLVITKKDSIFSISFSGVGQYQYYKERFNYTGPLKTYGRVNMPIF